MKIKIINRTLTSKQFEILQVLMESIYTKMEFGEREGITFKIKFEDEEPVPIASFYQFLGSIIKDDSVFAGDVNYNRSIYWFNTITPFLNLVVRYVNRGERRNRPISDSVREYMNMTNLRFLMLNMTNLNGRTFTLLGTDNGLIVYQRN